MPVDRTVEASLSDEQGWKHRGELDFMDNQMDRSSGTIHARASLPNPDLFIAAGQFARLRLPTSAPEADAAVAGGGHIDRSVAKAGDDCRRGRHRGAEAG